jgi:hypothetical protein
MHFQMEMLARDRQAKLLDEATESRMRRLVNGQHRSVVHPSRRELRPSLGRR